MLYSVEDNAAFATFLGHLSDTYLNRDTVERNNILSRPSLMDRAQPPSISAGVHAKSFLCNVEGQGLLEPDL